MAIKTAAPPPTQPLGFRPGFVQQSLEEPDVSHILLPTKKSQPSQNLSDYILFFYGEKKIGKTSLASNFDGALHLFFEPGGKGLSTYSLEIANWAEFKKVLELLKSPAGDDFATVVIDTVDIAYELCFDYCVEFRLGGMTPQQKNDYGESWRVVRKEFSEAFMSIPQELKRGLIMISHAKESDIKTRNMGTWTKIVPTLPNQAVAFCAGAADLNAYYGYYTSAQGNRERRLVISGSDQIEAGGRMKKFNFRTTNGKEIHSIDMGTSDEEAYANFVAAFNNELDDDGSDVVNMALTLTDLSSAIKARGKKAE